MNVSPLAYKAFGISMKRRATRRRLVVVMYIGLALICGATFIVERFEPSAFSWVLYSSLAVVMFVFGGQGRFGLLKSFANKPPRDPPQTVQMLQLYLDPLSLGTPEVSSWKNDERELSRRDHAHYVAYQPLIIGFLAILLLSVWTLHPPRWGSPAVIAEAMFAVAMVACVLVLTLPSALILWKEPDLDVD
jgi:peptidoglycan/LPS O-acetylase OafA/YrhL